MNHLAEILVPIGVLGTLAYGITLVTKTFTDYFLKRKMIDKGLESNLVSELLKKQVEGVNQMSNLKWGLIILFGGIGLIAIDSIKVDLESPLPYGIFAASISFGFLIYYFIASRKLKE